MPTTKKNKKTHSCETNEAYCCQTETDNDKKKVQQSKYVEMLTSGQMDNTLQTDCVASHGGRGKAVTGYLLAYQFQPTKSGYFDGIVAQ